MGWGEISCRKRALPDGSLGYLLTAGKGTLQWQPWGAVTAAQGWVCEMGCTVGRAPGRRQERDNYKCLGPTLLPVCPLKLLGNTSTAEGESRECHVPPATCPSSLCRSPRAGDCSHIWLRHAVGPRVRFGAGSLPCGMIGSSLSSGLSFWLIQSDPL